MICCCDVHEWLVLIMCEWMVLVFVVDGYLTCEIVRWLGVVSVIVKMYL